MNLRNLKATAVQRYKQTDWDSAIARGVRLWLLTWTVAVYLVYIRVTELPAGTWSLETVGTGITLADAGFIAAAIASVITPVIWLGYRLIFKRFRVRGVDIGVVLMPAVLTGAVVAVAIAMEVQHPTGTVPPLSDIAVAWAWMTAILSLPWFAGVSFLAWRDRRTHLNRRQVVAATVAVLLVCSSVPVAGLAMNGDGSTDSVNQTGASDDEYRYTEFSVENPAVNCGKVERYPSDVPAVRNLTGGYQPDAVHDAGEFAAAANLVYQNGSKPDTYGDEVIVRLQPAAEGDARVVFGGSYGLNDTHLNSELDRYQSNGTFYSLFLFDEEQRTHVWWDAIHENGTVHRYVTRVCHAGA